ncbi:MAG: phosphoribosylformylglycinamidine synthase subunit PurQ [candidate division Zixibacteria bacterium]|nr:phosphoribosylformylglycinamidine synthase subunit PurQ [candidate division Zixibacteria bacterium]
MTFGVIVFPGSNCDYDAYRAVKDVLNQPVKFIWHKDTDLAGADVIIIPGGFSYGDYLRGGAIARFSPVIGSVMKFAESGGIVLGICNGFQILCESGLLPGALVRNRNLRFICKDVYLLTENSDTVFTQSLSHNEVIRLPVAHNDGNYYCSEKDYEYLKSYKGITFRYCDKKGNVDDKYNPNGSSYSIAGIINEKGNVMAMMPHPERYMESILHGDDGRKIFESILESQAEKVLN